MVAVRTKSKSAACFRKHELLHMAHILSYLSHAVACDIKNCTHFASLCLLNLANPDHMDTLANSWFLCMFISTLLAPEGFGGVSPAAAVSGGLDGWPAPQRPAVRPALSHQSQAAEFGEAQKSTHRGRQPLNCSGCDSAVAAQCLCMP